MSASVACSSAETAIALIKPSPPGKETMPEDLKPEHHGLSVPGWTVIALQTQVAEGALKLSAFPSKWCYDDST